MFEFNGNLISLEDIQNKAKEKGYDVDTYVNFLKEQGLVEKAQDDSTPDVTKSSQPSARFQAVDLESASDDISSELPQVTSDDTKIQEKAAIRRLQSKLGLKDFFIMKKVNLKV